jgi:SAM-dependent methyltransferase
MIEDGERPPVLAQQRFEEDRAAFADLNLRQRFERIHRTNLWGAPTSVSGLGSEASQTTVLTKELPLLLQNLGVTSVLDAPCGDASWITRAALPIRYIGIDIVPGIIAAQQRRASEHREFAVADITNDRLPAADAILCRDCLVHLTLANIQRAVANFKRTGARFLITTTFTAWQVNRDIEDGDWRPLNLQAAPFHWPGPLDLLNEGCTEAGGFYRDKSLGVWRLSDIAS